MKRQIFTIMMVLALTMVAGVVFAQSSLNTTAPGPTQQQEPGQTNNNLPNPGNPVPTPTTKQQPVQEQGTVSGTATESMNGNQGANTGSNLNQQGTGTTTGTMQNKPEEGMDVDVDTGANARGAIDVDVNRTSDADTDASGIDETGSMDHDAQSGTYSGDNANLPQTASDLPTLAMFGLLALFGAVAVRRVRA